MAFDECKLGPTGGMQLGLTYLGPPLMLACQRHHQRDFHVREVPLCAQLFYAVQRKIVMLFER